MFRIVKTSLFVVPWRCGVGVITTAQLHSTKPEIRFCAGSKSCSRRVRDSQYWGSLTRFLAGNKAKHLSPVNHTTKAIHHCHHRHHHHHHHYVNMIKTDTSNVCCFRNELRKTKRLHGYFKWAFTYRILIEIS